MSYRITITITFFLLIYSSYSQNILIENKELNKFEELTKVIESYNFSLKCPEFASLFSKDDNECSSNKKNASLKWFIIPGEYKKICHELSEFKSSSKEIFIDSLSIQQNESSFFFLFKEVVTPRGSCLENLVLINGCSPINSSITVGFVGGYPKAYHKEFKDLFIKTFLTFKKKPNSL